MLNRCVYVRNRRSAIESDDRDVRDDRSIVSSEREGWIPSLRTIGYRSRAFSRDRVMRGSLEEARSSSSPKARYLEKRSEAKRVLADVSRDIAVNLYWHLTTIHSS